MSYEKLIEKLKSSENQDFVPPEREIERKLTFLEFKAEDIKKFRLLPNKTDPEDVPYVELKVHLLRHPNFENNFRNIICKGKDCPSCKKYKAMEKVQDPDAWKYKAQTKYLYYVITENDDGSLNLGLLTLTYYAQEVLKKLLLSQLKSGFKLWDIEEGRWIEMSMKITKDGEKSKRNYISSVFGDPEEASHPSVMNWFKDARPLEKFYPEYTTEDFEKILKGEKIELKNKKNSNTSNVATKPKTSTKKYESDEVDSVDEIPDTVDETPSNMKRLEDIMNSTEDDLEDN